MFPSPKFHVQEVGPFEERSVKLIVPSQLNVSLAWKDVIGADAGYVHDQFNSKPLPFTAWSACNKIVIAPPVEITTPGLPVKTLQNCPNDGELVEDELQNEQYSYNYSPIIGTTIKTIGRSPITLKMHFNSL